MSLIVSFPDQRRRASKKVRFSTMSELSFFERNEVEDSHNMHYSKKEYEEMRADIKRSVEDTRRRMSSLSSTSSDSEQDDANLSLLVTGIENLVSPGVIKKLFSSRMCHVRAVLNEQARQERSGRCDPDRLARVSQSHTEWANKRARTIGMLQHRSK